MLIVNNFLVCGGINQCKAVCHLVSWIGRGMRIFIFQILIWSYSCVFLPPMSTAIRTSVFAFVGTLNDRLYIP